MDHQRSQLAAKVYADMENGGPMVAQGGMALVEYSIAALEENGEGFLFVPKFVGRPEGALES